MPNEVSSNENSSSNQYSNWDHWAPVTVGVGAVAFVTGTMITANSGGILAPIGAGMVSYGVNLISQTITSEEPPSLFTKQSAKAFVGGAVTGVAFKPFVTIGASFLSESASLLVGSSAAGVTGYVSREITGNLVDGSPLTITPTGILTSAAAGPVSLITGDTIASVAPALPQDTLTNAAMAGITGGATGAAIQTTNNSIEVLTGKREKSKLFEGVPEAAILGATISAAQSVLTPHDTSSQLAKKRKREEEDTQREAAKSRKTLEEGSLENNQQNTTTSSSEDAIISGQERSSSLTNSSSTQAGNHRNSFFGNTATRHGAKQAVSKMIKEAVARLPTEQNTDHPHNFIANFIATKCFEIAFGPDGSRWDWASFAILEGQLVEDQKGNGDDNNCRMQRTGARFFGHRDDGVCHTPRISISANEPRNLPSYTGGNGCYGLKLQ